MKSICSILLGALAVLILLAGNGSAFVAVGNCKSSSSLGMRTHDAAEETFTGIYKGYHQCIYNIPGDYPPASSILPWDQQPANSGEYYPAPRAIEGANDTPMPETASVSYKNFPDEK